MQSMAHELEREGFEICGGIGVSRERVIMITKIIILVI